VGPKPAKQDSFEGLNEVREVDLWRSKGRRGMLYPYFKLTSQYSYGKTRGTAKGIGEMNFKIKNWILLARYATVDLNMYACSTVLHYHFKNSITSNQIFRTLCIQRKQGGYTNMSKYQFRKFATYYITNINGILFLIRVMYPVLLCSYEVLLKYSGEAELFIKVSNHQLINL